MFSQSYNSELDHSQSIHFYFTYKKLFFIIHELEKYLGSDYLKRKY